MKSTSKILALASILFRRVTDIPRVRGLQVVLSQTLLDMLRLYSPASSVPDRQSLSLARAAIEPSIKSTSRSTTNAGESEGT